MILPLLVSRQAVAEAGSGIADGSGEMVIEFELKSVTVLHPFELV
jgi:hypothetical protein